MKGKSGTLIITGGDLNKITLKVKALGGLLAVHTIWEGCRLAEVNLGFEGPAILVDISFAKFASMSSSQT